ncbi:MAG: Rne/Rng family ribonuclease [Planctomycetota bacterium]|jgi:ribonuclease E
MPAKQIMVINALDPEEIRVAVLVEDALDELYVETRVRGASAGSIYKGRVVNFQRSLEAAFVDIGTGKHGFLHVSDVAFEGSAPRRADADRAGRAREFLRAGREFLVQVKKEGVGDKGPGLTGFIGLPGRYLVLMPSLGRIGVSRRIRDRDTREALKKILSELKPPEDLGFVIRTEARTTNARELRKDADDLLARWGRIVEFAGGVPAPALLHEEADLTVRALRDHLAARTSEIWLDTRDSYERAQRFIEENAPTMRRACKLYRGNEAIFARFGVEKLIQSLMDRRVALPGGGTIIIEQTEAMTVVDVNSGRARRRRSSAAMIRQTNLEAAREVARHLRLRDIGGLVVIDFIDMESAEDRARVESELRAALERDKARTSPLPISDLGILEMTRQRRRQTLERRTSESCPVCAGLGLVRSTESISVGYLRELRSRLLDVARPAAGFLETGHLIVSRFHPERALAVANRLRAEVAALEAEYATEIVFQGDPAVKYGRFEIEITPDHRVPARPRSKLPVAAALAGATPVAPAVVAVEDAEAVPPARAAREAPAKPKGAPASGGGKAAPKKKKKKRKRRGKRGGKRHRKKSSSEAPSVDRGSA